MKRIPVAIAHILVKANVLAHVKTAVVEGAVWIALQNVLQIAKAHVEDIVMVDCLFRGSLV